VIGNVDVERAVRLRDLVGERLEAITCAAGSALEQPQLAVRARRRAAQPLDEECHLPVVRRIPIEGDLDVRALGPRIIPAGHERTRIELDALEERRRRHGRPRSLCDRRGHGLVDGRRVAGCNGQGCRENGNHGSSRHPETHGRWLCNPCTSLGSVDDRRAKYLEFAARALDGGCARRAVADGESVIWQS